MSYTDENSRVSVFMHKGWCTYYDTNIKDIFFSPQISWTISDEFVHSLKKNEIQILIFNINDIQIKVQK